MIDWTTRQRPRQRQIKAKEGYVKREYRHIVMSTSEGLTSELTRRAGVRVSWQRIDSSWTLPFPNLTKSVWRSRGCGRKVPQGLKKVSLPADVLWGSFVTHSWMRDKRTPKDVCGEVTKRSHSSRPAWRRGLWNGLFDAIGYAVLWRIQGLLYYGGLTHLATRVAPYRSDWRVHPPPSPRPALVVSKSQKIIPSKRTAEKY